MDGGDWFPDGHDVGWYPEDGDVGNIPEYYDGYEGEDFLPEDYYMPEDADWYPEDMDPYEMQQYMKEIYGEDYLEAADSGGGLAHMDLQELGSLCIIPTLQQGLTMICPLLLLCLTFRLLEGASAWTRHLMSTGLGLATLYLVFEANWYFIVTFAITGHLLLHLMEGSRWRGVAASIMALVFLLTCELFIVEATDWHKIRGAQMILAMKIISLGFDLDSGVVQATPSFLEYSGYCCFLGTSAFGPWISYNDYLQVLKSRNLSLQWFVRGFMTTLQCLACLTVSTCLAYWVIRHDINKWVTAYRDALSFRFSHYFISYLSEMTCVASGVGVTEKGTTREGEGTDQEEEEDVKWDLRVARPYHIELPRSLVEVVTNWNRPMHHWLKTYVFKTAKPLGAFPAIILTYAASAILHGLNFQLAAVLLSLGFYSYIEHVLRQRLADIFSACILAKRCKPDCGHRNQPNWTGCVGLQLRRDFWKQDWGNLISIEDAMTCMCVGLTNLCFCLLAMFHLAYLGVMFDSSSDVEEEGYTMSHTLHKWAQLDYASHWVAVGSFVFYKLI
ncbi:protein-serine O-palmitoleoyltransferase porcupine-like [Branchiostoma floridae x Branchiostoma japonicum]